MVFEYKNEASLKLDNFKEKEKLEDREKRALFLQSKNKSVSTGKMILFPPQNNKLFWHCKLVKMNFRPFKKDSHILTLKER